MNPIDQQVQLTTLNSGLRVLSIHNPNTHAVSLNSFILTGSSQETPENNGISHFVEHMLFRGNLKLGSEKELNNTIEKIGGEINATTSFDQIEVWMNFHQRFLEEGIDIFCKFLKYPEFNNIETERSIILEEILNDYNEDNVLIDLDSLSYLNLWDKHSIRLPVIGSKETVSSISVSHLRDWFKTHFHPSNMIIMVEGNFNSTIAIDTIKNHFDHLEAHEYLKSMIPLPQAEQKHVFVKDSDSQFYLQWSFPFPGNSKEEQIQANVISRILDDGSNSRLQSVIREKHGLLYEISANQMSFNNCIIFSINAVVSKNNMLELLKELKRLITQLQLSGVSDEELGHHMHRYTLHCDYCCDSSKGKLYDQLNKILYNYYSGPFEVKEYLGKLTRHEVNKTISRIFNADNSVLVMVGPWDGESTKKAKNILH